MARHHVESAAWADRPADLVWRDVRDFCAPWHPAVKTMQRVWSPQGHVIREFSVWGAETVYRERLTWFSDSDRAMGYTHLSGIDGVDRYDARLEVREAPGGCTVVMTADLEAPEPRGAQIAAGTQAIFDAGTAALARRADAEAGGRERPVGDPQDPAKIDTRIIAGTPMLAVSVNGAKGGDLCLFLHGIGGNRGNWDRQLAGLAGHHRAAALDLRGYGGSALGADATTVDDHCNDILRVADALGADRLVLCGLSFGAWIATSFAMRHPDRLSGLVLAGGCTGMSEAPAAVREGFRASRAGPLAHGKTPTDFAAEVVAAIAGPGADAGVRETLAASMSAIPAATYMDAVTCFTNPPEQFDFTRLSMPVLLMTGEHDQLAPPDEIRGVAQRIHVRAPKADVRFEVLAGAGHVCNLEAPAAFDAPLRDLLDRVLG